jgi:hypothetical protein
MMHLPEWLAPVYAVVHPMFLSCWTWEMKVLWSFETMELLVHRHFVSYYGAWIFSVTAVKIQDLTCVYWFFCFVLQVSVPFGQHLISSHALNHPHHEPRNIHNLPVPAHSPAHQQGPAEQAPSQGNTRSAGSKSASFDTITLHAMWQTCLIVTCRMCLVLKVGVCYWYGHWVKLVDRNMLGKVLEIEGAVLWRHVMCGQG